MAKLVWITGLAGSGKTTIGREVYLQYKQFHPNIFFLDGDVFREIIGKSSGYSREERFDVAMQIARMCKCFVEQDINVICSTISLFKEVHQYNRNNITNYYEVFIDCNMNELLKRDKKGIYSRALKGEINNVVGIDISYDKPVHCNLVLKNETEKDIQTNIESIINLILT
jgi:cytidine diphosphoramidate kinase